MSSNEWSPLSTSFWTLQAIGWGGYGVFWYLASLPVYERTGVSLGIAVVRVLYYVAIGAGITLAFRPLYRRLWRRGTSLSVLLLVSVVGSLLGSVVWLFLFEAVKWPLDAAPFSGAYGASSLWYFARPVLSNSIVLVAWSALYFGIKYQRNLSEQQAQTLRAEALAREARLQMLRYQLNPHFLFNTLNTLLTLIGNENRRAKTFVTQLAAFLRYSLLDAESRTVPLREEIEMIRSFLSIEKLRFEDQLEVEYDVDSDANSVSIPPFLLQPLVENALKHGRATSPSPLRIRLGVTYRPGRLRIEVANTGRLRSAGEDQTEGIGLRNVQERLRKLYPERHHFSLREEDGWVRAELVLEEDVDEAGRVRASSV